MTKKCAIYARETFALRLMLMSPFGRYRFVGKHRSFKRRNWY